MVFLLVPYFEVMNDNNSSHNSLFSERGNDPEIAKARQAVIRLYYFLQQIFDFLQNSSDDMVTAQLDGKFRRIVTDSVSILSNCCSIIGLFCPPMLSIGGFVSIGCTAYRMNDGDDIRYKKRKANHSMSAIAAYAYACAANCENAFQIAFPRAVCASFEKTGIFVNLKNIMEIARSKLSSEADRSQRTPIGGLANNVGVACGIAADRAARLKPVVKAVNVAKEVKGVFPSNIKEVTHVVQIVNRIEISSTFKNAVDGGEVINKFKVVINNSARIANTVSITNAATDAVGTLTGVKSVGKISKNVKDVSKITNAAVNSFRTLDSAADVAENALQIGSSLSQTAIIVGGVLNGIAIAADVYSLVMDYTDDGKNDVSKLMSLLSGEMKTTMETLEIMCPKVKQICARSVQTFEMNSNFRFIDIDIDGAKYGDIIKGVDKDENSTYYLSLDDGYFLEFMPNQMNAPRKLWQGFEKFLAENVPTDWLSSKAVESCTSKGYIRQVAVDEVKNRNVKVFISNMIDKLSLPSSPKRIKQRVHYWLSFKGEIDYNVLSQNSEHFMNYLRTGFGFSFETMQFCQYFFDPQHDPIVPGRSIMFRQATNTPNVRYDVQEPDKAMEVYNN